VSQLVLDGCAGIVLAPTDEPDRDTWCTPKWLADAVGKFDLDPCSNDRSHIQAQCAYSLSRGQDGLFNASLWGEGDRVWINPPYSANQVIRWIRAYGHTRFCFLVRLDPSTGWYGELYNASELLLVPRGKRLDFDPPPGVAASSNPFPHVLAYRFAEDATDAIKALCFEWRTT
jgi:hypothetical protein